MQSSAAKGEGFAQVERLLLQVLGEQQNKRKVDHEIIKCLLDFGPVGLV
eukprot:gene3514-3969_t